MKTSFKILFTAISGGVGVLGFSPFNLWFAPFFSLLFLILILEGEKARTRIGLLMIYGLAFFLPLLHWSSIYVGSLPWLLLGFGQALFLTGLALAFPSGKFNISLFICYFFLIEFFRAKWPFGGFGWGRFGFSALDSPYQEWLRIGGVPLTGAIVAASSALIAISIIKRDKFLPFLIIPIIFIPSFATPSASALIGSRQYQVGVIQGGVSQLGLEFNSTPRDVFDRHFLETVTLLEKNADIDLILWPENASDLDPLKDREINAKIAEISNRYKIPMIIGAVLQGDAGPKNVSIMFGGDGQVQTIYRKRDLVPFGEYIPLRRVAAKFSPLVNSVIDFQAGKDIIIHKLSDIAFSPLICYEILDDNTVLKSMRSSNIGVVQTNNATFGRSWQSAQQFQMTRVRAYEYQIPFIVAATTGQSAHIGINGEIIQSIPSFQSGSFVLIERPRQARMAPVTIPLQFFLATLIPFIYYSVALKRRVRSKSENS